jgi:hypothetical protein
VRLSGGALASAADAQVLDGANAAALQRPDGAWEVLQFANAELVGERIYELSRFLRGQVGSEWAMADPLPAGSPFVVLNEHVVPVARGLDMLLRPMQWRAVAASRDHGDASAVALSVTPQSTALKPLAPVHPAARRTEDGIAISWIRRKRGTMPAHWSVQVPIGEDNEAYVLEVLDGAAVVRTFATATPGVTYSTAEQIADFGTPQVSLSVRVHQLSAAVGRGFATSATLVP